MVGSEVMSKSYNNNRGKIFRERSRELFNYDRSISSS
jgi:hypothetical protein